MKKTILGVLLLMLCANIKAQNDEVNTRFKVKENTNSIELGQWDGSRNRVESVGRKLFLTSYTGGISFGNSGTEQITMNNAGYFGIGTITPNYLLHVDSGNNPTIAIGTLNKNTMGKSSLKFFAGVAERKNGFSVVYNKTLTTDRLSFMDGGDIENLSILNGGNIGIGTTSPNDKLEVAGNGKGITIHQENSGNIFNGIKFKAYNDGINGGLLWNQASGEIRLNAASTYYPTFYSGGAERMRIKKDGYVGIGTADPSEKLEIKNGGLKLSTNDATGNYELKIKANHDYNNKFVMSSGNTVVFQEKVIPDVGGTQNSKSFISNYYGIGFSTATLNPSTKDHVNMYISGASDPNGSGYVGIGTTTPDKQLTVKNEIKILKSGNTRAKGDKAEIIFGEAKSDFYSGSIKIENTNSNPGYVNPKMVFSLQDYNTNALEDVKERMTISSKGNVGIGTEETGVHKLAVEGSIGAREIKVQATGWYDFVFEKDYNLPTIKEVEKHIKEKGHLKDIPSEKEVLKNGIYLGEMDGKLLQKIEELTLYTIQQEKKINEQEKKMNMQEEKIKKQEEKLKSLKDLSDRLSKLEKLLKSK
ncbi:hypothetical protein [Tenacibaculum aiptasiae]|uniref:hypothetical protein n=1 Tax=Tenacibaculum aiptasiae TaxID=426481 RepID=UPI003B5B58A1